MIGTALVALACGAAPGALGQDASPPAIVPLNASPPPASLAREPARVPAFEPALRTNRDPRVFAPVRAQVQAPITRLAPIPPAPAAPRRPEPDAAPFEPLGIRAGPLTLRPSISQSVGWDSNPERVESGAIGRALSRTRGAATLETSWSRHALAGSATATYDAYRGGGPEPRFSGDAGLALRLDIRDDVALTIGATAATATERIGSPALPSDLADSPQTSTLGASAALDIGFNRLGVQLRGGIERTLNGDATRRDGTRADRSIDDFDETNAAARLSYEVSPALRPYVEVGIDGRRYDAAGAQRDSRGLTGLVGAEIEITRVIAGDVSAGWERRTYEDPSRAASDGAVAAAQLVWSPTPLTRVTLAGESRIAETSVGGATGARARSVSLAVSHEARRNLVLDASVRLATTDYQGSALNEELIAATAGLEWRLTRTLAVTASYTREHLHSTEPGADYTADIALFGIRLAR